MSERTFGETKDCRSCRFWSEMVAKAEGGRVQALCLSPTSPRNGTYTHGRHTCPSWASGELGAVDEPGTDPARYDEDEVEL